MARKRKKVEQFVYLLLLVLAVVALWIVSRYSMGMEWDDANERLKSRQELNKTRERLDSATSDTISVDSTKTSGGLHN